MPPRRSALSEISPNVNRRPNLSPEQRERICAKLDAGVSYQELMEEFRVNRSTIWRTKQRQNLHNTTQELPRSGRPPILSDRSNRQLYRIVRTTPKIEYTELASELGWHTTTTPSRSTLYRAIKRMKLKKFPCKKKPLITKKNQKKRLLFARKWRNWD